MKPFHFETDCVSCPNGDDINEMKAGAAELTYRTMLRRCPGLLDRAVELGYERSVRQGHGLTLRNDCHVSYHKGSFRGRPCYYFVWPGIEQIFTQENT